MLAASHGKGNQGTDLAAALLRLTLSVQHPHSQNTAWTTGCCCPLHISKIFEGLVVMKEQNRKSFSLKFGSTWVQKIIKKTPERNSPRCAIVARADVQVVPTCSSSSPGRAEKQAQHLTSEIVTQTFPSLSFNVGEVENFKSL